MNYAVVLAEKPSQAKKIATAFSQAKRKDGYWSCSDPKLLSGKEVRVSWAIGHLVRPVDPDFYNDAWVNKHDLSQLPMTPKRFEYEVDKDKKEQYEIVAGLIRKSNHIIWGGDPGREGNLISYLICLTAGVWDKPGVIYERLWIHNLEVKTVRQGFYNLQPIQKSFQDALAGQARQIGDWLVGMNGSRLYDSYIKQTAPSLDGKGIFSIGRVQSPTLSLIYQRELAIRSFVPEDYYEIEAEMKTSKGTYRGRLLIPDELKDKWNGKAKNEQQLRNFLAKYGVPSLDALGVVDSVEEEEKSTPAPELLNLSELQKRMNSSQKVSAKQTLDAAQFLYDDEFQTYPRTEFRHITPAQYELLKKNVQKIADAVGYNGDNFIFTPSKRHVNEDKVGDHEALTTTSKFPDDDTRQAFSPLVEAVYIDVAKTTLGMFLPKYRYNQTIIRTKVGELFFETKGSTPIETGWKELWQTEKRDDETEESDLPEVAQGDRVAVKLNLVKKTTKAPSYYTEATLLTAMINADKMEEDADNKEALKQVKGIGTEATRASIIEGLKAKKYIVVKKNQLRITPQGEILAKALQKERLLSSVQMTAVWELFLEKVSSGEKNPEEFIDKVSAFVTHLVEVTKDNISGLDFSDEISRFSEENKALAQCPKCGSDMYLNDMVFSCVKGRLTKEEVASGKQPECSFMIWRKQFGKKLTEKQCADLITKGKTGKITFKKKSGGNYNGSLKLLPDGKVELVPSWLE